MNRTTARKVFSAAKLAGVKPLGRYQLYDTLLLSARTWGTHEATNHNACYELAEMGLVEIRYPWAFATPAGLEVLAAIAKAAAHYSRPSAK